MKAEHGKKTLSKTGKKKPVLEMFYPVTQLT